MSTISLPRKYRPQSFAAVAGQKSVRTVLSRACELDSPAAAYLFSGTRGVGKTTLARILAKALNCETAPTGEPCNVCRFCKSITAGSCPDVVEIDAATHGNVEEARKLKEEVGYAPLECRYKIFIIDEAHMLSRAAFNALLKTLEEPPGRVCFVLATTEPHKILPTIISRCQHFVFGRLSEAELAAHLGAVLDKEGLGYEPEALRLVAKRGAGSVRDCMSLLGQVMAYGLPELTEAATREILGLAGSATFAALVSAIRERDVAAMSEVAQAILGQGLDLGFFLRELSALLRDLFLLKRLGAAARATVNLAADDLAALAPVIEGIPLPHLHACWQMVLEGQRRVLFSIEPGLALELLLLNLAMVAELVPLGDAEWSAAKAPPPPPADLSGLARQSASKTMHAELPSVEVKTLSAELPGTGLLGSAPAEGPRLAAGKPEADVGAHAPKAQAAPEPAAAEQRLPEVSAVEPESEPLIEPEFQAASEFLAGDLAPEAGQAETLPQAARADDAVAPGSATLEGLAPATSESATSALPTPEADAPGAPSPEAHLPEESAAAPAPESEPMAAPAAASVPLAAPASEPAPATEPLAEGLAPEIRQAETPAADQAPAPRQDQGSPAAPPGWTRSQRQGQEPAPPMQVTPPKAGARDWTGFLDFYDQRYAETKVAVVGMKRTTGEVVLDGQEVVLRLGCINETHQGHINQSLTYLTELAREYFGPATRLEVGLAKAVAPKRRDQIQAEVINHPLLNRAMELFGARVLDIKPKE